MWNHFCSNTAALSLQISPSPSRLPHPRLQYASIPLQNLSADIKFWWWVKGNRNGQKGKIEVFWKELIFLSSFPFLSFSYPCTQLPELHHFNLPFLCLSFGLNPTHIHTPPPPPPLHSLYAYILISPLSSPPSPPHPLQICRSLFPPLQAPLVDAALWITAAWPSGSSPAMLDA